VWVATIRAARDQHVNERESHPALTAIESFTSCGRLEPLSAAEAAEAKRVGTQLMRGARNAAPTRLDDIRRAIVSVQP